MLELMVPGEPRGKGRLRHRVVRSKENPMGYASGYTPASTREYQAHVAVRAREAWKIWPGKPPAFDGAVFLHVIAFKSIPESWSRAKQAAARRGDLRPTSKPDWDNYGKVVSDALNTIAFKDDAQVADAFVQKYYSDNPRLCVTVQSAKVSPDEYPTIRTSPIGSTAPTGHAGLAA